MQHTAFERFTVEHVHLNVSICRACRRFVGAARDPALLAAAERLHDCSQVSRKPPAKVWPQLPRTFSVTA